MAEEVSDLLEQTGDYPGKNVLHNQASVLIWKEWNWQDRAPNAAARAGYDAAFNEPVRLHVGAYRARHLLFLRRCPRAIPAMDDRNPSSGPHRPDAFNARKSPVENAKDSGFAGANR